jgi:hypothetical protein
MSWIALAALLGACGGKALPSYEKRPCDESIRARAAGTYANQTEADAKKRQRNYRESCKTICTWHGEPECLEGVLLDADAEGAYGVRVLLRPLCKEGNKGACDWLATHAAEVARWDTYDGWRDQNTKERDAAVRASAAERAAAEAPSRAALDSFAVQLKGSSSEFSVLRDETYSLDGDYTAFTLQLKLGGKYVLECAVADPSRIKARIEGGGDMMIVPPATASYPGVFHLRLAFEAGPNAATAPQVIVTSIGGPLGPVRCIHLEKR